MKKYLTMLQNMDKISANFTKTALYATTFCAATLFTYCLVLKIRGDFSLQQAQLMKNSLEYVAASASLGVCFGLLIDLVIKKGI